MTDDNDRDTDRDVEADPTSEEQPANDVTEALLDREEGEELSLSLADGTEIRVSVVRAMYLPDSSHDAIGGGSLRHAVRASEEAADRLDLPSREGLVAAEEHDPGAWCRPRLEFYDLVTVTDDDGEEYDDYGGVQRTHEITAATAR